MQKLFKILSLFTVAIGIALGVTAIRQNAMEEIDIQDDECPVCMTIPAGENALVATPCCARKLCKKCLGKLGTKRPQGDFEHQRGFKECPFCRKDITQFVEEHALETQPGSISYLLEHGRVEIDSASALGRTLRLRNLNINDLTGLQEIPDIQRVEIIILSGNQLTTLPEGIFSGLNNLLYLILSDNQLTTLPEGIFSGLNNLEILDLSLNPDLRNIEIEDKLYKGNDLQDLLRRLSMPSATSPRRPEESQTEPMIVQTQQQPVQPVSIRQLLQQGRVQIGFSRNQGSLNLRNLKINDLTGLQEIPDIRNVKAIDLSLNQLTTLPSRIFNNLPNLEELHLNSNQLTILPDNIFTGLTRLMFLGFSNNHLTTLPEGITQLPSLVELNLSYNPGLRRIGMEDKVYRGNDLQVLLMRLSTSPAISPRRQQPESDQTEPILAQMQQQPVQTVSVRQMLQQGIRMSGARGNRGLVFLNLSDSNISDLTGLQEIPGIQTVKDLVINDNQLTTLPTGIFNGLTDLESLTLENNLLTTLPADIFSGLTKLEFLNLSGNKLETLPAGIFNGLINLGRLDLTKNQLKTLPASAFNGLTNLKKLYLSYNQLRTFPAGVFNGLTNLEYLGLNRNNLIAVPEEIAQLPRLNQLGLNNNPLLRAIGIDDQNYYRGVDLEDIFRRSSTPPTPQTRGRQ